MNVIPKSVASLDSALDSSSSLSLSFCHAFFVCSLVPYAVRIHFSTAFSIVAIYPILVRCSTRRIAYRQADKYISIISFMLSVHYDKFVTICLLSTWHLSIIDFPRNYKTKKMLPFFVCTCRMFSESKRKTNPFCYNSILSKLPLFSAFWLLQYYWVLLFPLVAIISILFYSLIFFFLISSFLLPCLLTPFYCDASYQSFHLYRTVAKAFWFCSSISLAMF